MVINHETYLVIKELGSSDSIKEFLVKKQDTEDYFHVTQQDRDSVTGEEVKFLLEQTKNPTFVDFCDYITTPDYLQILMKYETSMTLEEKLQIENCNLVERLEIMKHILERIMILNMPSYFLHSAITPQGILISRSLDIAFDYDLKTIAGFKEITFQDVEVKFAHIFRILFSEEIKLKAIKELENLVYGLEHGEFEQFEDIYGAFRTIYKLYVNNPVIKPQTRQFKWWEKIKSLSRFLGILTKIAVFGVAIVYLILSIQNFTAEPDVNQNFTQIGTKMIEP